MTSTSVPIVPNASPVTAPGPFPASHAFGSLYVGDLSPDITEAMLFEVFTRAGAVSSIRVCRDATTRRSLGYAYVNFHSVSDAERALDTLNFQQIKDRPCRIMWSHRDPAIRKSSKGNTFVKNLAPSVDSKKLYDTFSQFGNILSCKVAVDMNGQSKGFGYVHFETEEGALKAIENVHGHVVAEKEMYVAKFERRTERSTGVNKFTNVYVKNIPQHWDSKKLQSVFETFGSITSLALRQNTEKHRGFGFVNFATHEEALNAVERASEFVTEDGEKLFADRFQKKSERMYVLTKQFDDKRRDKHEKSRNLNLYVKNLEEEVDSAKLQEMFAVYGPVSSAVVMTDDSGTSRGFGFICFANVDDANKALSEMNGKVFGTKPLYVNRAQRKADRQMQLDQQFTAGQRMQAMPMFYPPQMQFMMQQHYRRGPGPNGPVPNMPMRAFPQQNPGVAGPPPSAYQSYPSSNVHHSGNRQRGGGRGVSRGGYVPSNRGGARYSRGAMPSRGGYREQTPSMAIQSQELSAAMLANASPEMQKQILGERLYPLIFKEQPSQAAKITGMFLEMDTTEILPLLDGPQELHAKIQEALRVLESSGSA